MPTLTVAGHSVTVGDDFLKLSPDEQNKTVEEIAQHLPANKSSEDPSGIAAGFSKGVSDLAGGDASTLKIAGAPTGPLDNIEQNTKPSNYQAAHLIKEGGHWYNPSDYQPSAIPQLLAEQAPGMAQDMAAGWTAGKLTPGSATVKTLAGMGGYAGSALLRTFGPGAHANADARTGVPNSPVEGQDIAREGVKQAVEAPINMIGGKRLIPGADLPGKALSKYLTTLGTEGATGAAGNLVNQVGTTAGSKDGLNVDGNQVAEAAASRAAGSGLMVAPRALAETAANAKYGKFEANPETQAAAEALANRHLDIADGRKLVGPLGGTQVAAEAVNGAHTDVHSELAAASKGVDLSQGNANTLNRINNGDKVSPSELSDLGDEAPADVMHLARQAVISRQLRDSGNISDNKFTGGASGAIEKIVPNNVAGKTAAAAVGLALGHATGLTLPVVGAGAGAYGVSRMIDKLTGQRTPAQGFTDRFGGTDTPPRMPAAPAPEPEEAQPSLSKTLTANARVEDGMAKIAKMIGDQKRKQTLADALPLLKQLAATQQPQASPEAPAQPFNPTALSMLKAKLKAGLPPAPAPEAPANVPAPQPEISPTALAMLKQKLKQGLPPPPAPPAPPAPPVAAPPAPPPISPTALSMLKQKLKQGLPDATPASPQIAQAMQNVAQHNATQAAPPAAPAPTPEPVAMPQPPVIAKISKKLNGAVEQTPHPEQPFEKGYTPLEPESLWGKGMKDQAFAKAEADRIPDLKYPDRYMDGVIRDRQKRRGILADIVGEDVSPNADHAAALLEELHHTRRAEKASAAIQHFTAKMSPEMRDAIRKRMDKSFINSMWSK